MEHAHVRRLVWWNRFWLAVLALAALSWAGSQLMERIRQNHYSLTAFWDDGDLRLSSTSDGPFIVTHLAFWAGGEPDKRYAALPEPVVILDSGGARIKREPLEKLGWRDWRGQPASAAPKGAPITALYYRPLRSKHSQMR